MRCKYCGAENPDGSRFCFECGKNMEETVAAPSNENVQGENGTLSYRSPEQLYIDENKEKKTTMAPSTIRKIFIVALLCFALPFFTVACDGDTIEVSGFKAMLGVQNEEEDVYIDPNIYLLAAFGAGIVGIIIANKNIVHSSIAGAVGAVSVLVFRFNFKSFYNLEAVWELIDISFKFGWYIVFLAFLCTIEPLLDFLEQKKQK